MTRRGTLGLLCILIASSLVVAGQESYGALVDANAKFAFRYFREIAASQKDRNVLLAPTALSLDFALLQNGAGPVAKAAILSTFEFRNLSSEQINLQSNTLRHALSYFQPQLPKGYKRGPDTETRERLIMAGSLWIGPWASFRPVFVETAKNDYGVSAMKLPSDKGAAAVNSWVAAQTGGKLAHVIGSLQPDDFLFVNTIWFKGIWQSPFSPEATHPGDFTLNSGQKKSVPMMSESRKFGYLRGTKFQAVALEYLHAKMIVVLPDESSSLSEFIQSLTADRWSELMLSMGRRPGYLELPRFSAEFSTDVKDVLRQMGLESLFSSFTSFAPAVSNPEGAKLTRVLQIVRLKVDEKGTEIVSAGVTGGVIGGISAGQRPEEPFRMIVNRPFFFAVIDDTTHAILYLGAVVEP